MYARQSPPGELAARLPVNMFPIRYTNKMKKRVVDSLKQGAMGKLAKLKAVVLGKWPTSVAAAEAQRVGKWSLKKPRKSALRSLSDDEDERDGVPVLPGELVLLLISERVKKNLPIDRVASRPSKPCPVLCTTSSACFLMHGHSTGSDSTRLPSPCEEISVSPLHSPARPCSVFRPFVWPPPLAV